MRLKSLSNGRSQPARAALAWALPLVILASGLSLGSPAAAKASVSATPAEPCLVAEETESDAAAMAARCQSPVQVASATTETDQAMALPDGTVEFEHRYRPVRVERDGDWIPVDTTLQVQADGSVAPKAAAAEVTFSGGGTDPMVSVQNDDGEVALSSPWGALPTPTLAGNIATYREVRPGIDLRLTADVDGFSQVFVVKTRQAAKDPALNKLTFEMETDGLVVAANKAGNLKISDAETERLALTASTPVMWDSDTAAAPTAVAAPSVETVSDSDKARMPVTVDTDTMSITPDQKMLDAPDTKFPVYVDPSFTTYRTGFVMVTASNPTSTYFNTTDDALVGSNNGVNKWRTFFNFSTATAPFVGKQVLSADLRLQETWSGSCTPTPFDAYATYAAGSTTTWNNQPTWSTKQDTQTVAKGYSPSGMGGASACPAGEVRMAITPITQQAANNGGNITIGLRSPDETKVSHWKRFENNPKLSVIYNSLPQLLTQQTDSTGGCVTGTTRPILASTTPTLRASYSDPDSTPTTTTFEWWLLAGSAAIGTAAQSSVPVGTSAAIAVPAGQLASGGTYRWRVKAYDGSSTTAWSPWCEFTTNSYATISSRSASGVTTCITGDTRPTVATESPVLSAKVTDPEGSQTVKAEFQWWPVDDSTAVGGAVSTAAASGSVASVTVPAEQMKAGNAYAWRLRTFDNVGWGPYTGPCEFLVDPPSAVLDVDPAALATMQTQKALEPALRMLSEANTDPASGFAGLAYEGDGLSLYWKGALSTEMANAVTQARTVGPVTVKSAPYSEAQLVAEGEKIHAAVDAFGGTSEIQSIGYSPEGTGIVVEREPAPAEGHIADVQASATEVLEEAQVSVPVEVTTADAPAEPMAYNRFHDVPGYNGGGSFETYNTAGDIVNSCTLGFALRMEDVDYILSAGHCGNSGNDVYFGEFGASGKDFKKIGKVISTVKKFDLLLIKAPGNNRIWDGKVNTTNSIGVRGYGYWAKNQLVCFSGKRTGTMCNLKQLRSRDVTFPDGTKVKGVIETRQMDGKVAATFGDSGAPVYTYDGGAVTAKGSLTGGGGSTMYFQDWADVRRQYPAAQLKTTKR